MTLLLFQSTRQVITAEKLCLAAGIDYRIVPVPKEVSAACGMAIAITAEDAAKMQPELENHGISGRRWEKS